MKVVEIKRVLVRKYDKLKFVIIPKKSKIRGGDYVLIQKISPFSQREIKVKRLKNDNRRSIKNTK